MPSIVGTKDQQSGRYFSMVIICACLMAVVAVATVGLGAASLWVKELRDWPIAGVGLCTLAAIWLWCAAIYPLYLWLRHHE